MSKEIKFYVGKVNDGTVEEGALYASLDEKARVLTDYRTGKAINTENLIRIKQNHNRNMLIATNAITVLLLAVSSGIIGGLIGLGIGLLL